MPRVLDEKHTEYVLMKLLQIKSGQTVMTYSGEKGTFCLIGHPVCSEHVWSITLVSGKNWMEQEITNYSFPVSFVVLSGVVCVFAEENQSEYIC